MTIAELKKMSQKELDDLFRAKPAGPIPDGEAKGTALVLPGTPVTNLIADLVRLKVWKGKVFERDKNDPNKGILHNKILPLGHLAIEANVYKDKSWLDGAECVVLDYSETSLIAKKVRDEIREIEPGFYLGKVYWGKKRTIDFALEFQRSGK
ncbi:MAG: hypothetical protein PHC88_06020 [Terrimicrobiaceae bacterium]|nr:hypothetical protein [Terrimicrobiaceae bacterium]